MLMIMSTVYIFIYIYIYIYCVQQSWHTAMLTLVLEVDLYSWMMSSVVLVLVNYWNVLAGQSSLITASTLMMLV